MRTFISALAALVLSASLAACRSSHAPSGNLAKATRLYQAAEEAHGVDAPLDPAVDEVETLARETPEEAGDAEELRAFNAVLQQKRADRLAQIAREKKAHAQAQAAAEQEPSAAPASASAPDAGTGALPPVGSDAAPFLQQAGACVKEESPFFEKGGARRGVAYARVESAECEERLPALAGQLVFVAEGKIFNVAPRTAAERIELRAGDGGFEPILPDAGR